MILDWVPGHFATDPWALVNFDGTPLYEDPNPQRGWHKEWGSHIFNFGRHEVRNFLYANALYWLEEFHADGLRVDGVASMLYLDYSREEGEWTPNKHGGRENLEAVQFLQEMNATVYKRVPGATTIAEESTSWPGVTEPTSDGGLGFGFKWNMGWMHDSLDYVEHEPVHRAYHHGEMTFSLVYAWSENFVLPISHDEVVHGKGSLLRKMPGDRWQQLANLRAYLGYMWAHPGKQLLFMGVEMGQESEWAESRELDWWLLDHPEHRGVHSLVRDLNAAYTSSPALWSADNEPAGFQWIDANDAGRNVFSFVRRGRTAPTWSASATSPPSPTAASGWRCPGGSVGGGAQHRLRGLRRLRGRQPRLRSPRWRASTWASRARRHRGAPAGHRVVPQAGLTPRRERAADDGDHRRRGRARIAWVAGAASGSTPYDVRSRPPSPGTRGSRPSSTRTTRGPSGSRPSRGCAGRACCAASPSRGAGSTGSSTPGSPTTRRPTSPRASGRCSTPSCRASARSASCSCATRTAGCCCASSPTSATGTCPAGSSRWASRPRTRSPARSRRSWA